MELLEEQNKKNELVASEVFELAAGFIEKSGNQSQTVKNEPISPKTANTPNWRRLLNGEITINP
ncbi:hypothetical protein TURTL08_17740 [Turicimonas sp. TL08]